MPSPPPPFLAKMHILRPHAAGNFSHPFYTPPTPGRVFLGCGGGGGGVENSAPYRRPLFDTFVRGGG